MMYLLLKAKGVTVIDATRTVHAMHLTDAHGNYAGRQIGRQKPDTNWNFCSAACAMREQDPWATLGENEWMCLTGIADNTRMLSVMEEGRVKFVERGWWNKPAVINVDACGNSPAKQQAKQRAKQRRNKEY